MRVIRSGLFYLLLAMVIGGVSFVVAQRVMLFIASQQLIAEVNNLKQATTQQSYYTTCLELNRGFGLNGSDTIFQLRFVDNTAYVLEYACASTPKQSAVISEGLLPQYVTKIPGSSGFVYQQPDPASVTMTALAEYSDLAVEYLPFLAKFIQPVTTVTATEGRVIVQKTTPLTTAGPLTTCQGYGYQCCTDGSELGVGSPQKSSDCPDRCFTQCQPLPIILSFTMSPNFDQYTRTATIESGQSVDFWVVADAEAGSELEFEFGDGSQTQVSMESVPVQHSYTCWAVNCTYTAKVRVITPTGQVSADRFTSSLNVNVSSGIR